MLCSLCGSKTIPFSEIKGRLFLQCTRCNSILLDSNFFLSPTDEKNRYGLHQNDVNDHGYQNFVSPILNAVKKDYKHTHTGLDFGSGSSSIISILLEEQGYTIRTYDPFFDPNDHVLKNSYDFITCCEVMEHFYTPFKEFSLLTSLLNPKGTLYCKTNVYDQSIDFDSWWYKNDPTHVFFYTAKTLEWIKNTFKFKSLILKKDLITFRM